MVIYIYIFNCYILATKSFLRGSDDRLCKIKMIGEIRQNFTVSSASVGLILATALQSLVWSVALASTWSFKSREDLFLQGKVTANAFLCDYFRDR